MVEKSVRKRQLTSAEWAGLEQLRLSGMSIRDIAARAGLSESWVYRKLQAMAAEPELVKRARQRGALNSELARIYAALPDNKPADVERRAKAISALVRASRDMEGLMADTGTKADMPDDDEPSLEELRAELHRRLNRIRRDIEAKRIRKSAAADRHSGDPD